MATVFRSKRSSSIGTVATTVGGYSAPSVTTGVAITGLSVANTSASAVTVSIALYDGVTFIYVVKAAQLLPGGALSVADEGNRIVMNSGDQVSVISSLAGSVDAIMSVTEIT